MVFKFVVVAMFVVIAQAGYIQSPVTYSAPLAAAPIAPLAYSAPIAKYAPVPKFAAPLAYAAPIPKAAVAVTDAEYDPNPQYSYSYDVQDALTGDSKNQFETRNGDFVQGSYSLIDSDGTKRTVEYTADPINGFNAVVHKEPLAAPVLAKVAKIAAAPVAYSAPVPAPIAYGAPIANVAAPLAYGKAIIY